ncbi:MAG: protein-L-isoaspartate(D-aspartate) O-methyltransferase [bacterium]|nr:protein-L-isoaspartate(D-aspartate) O-methyltransferase [Candidatus Sumerlaeota bacterium]
MNTDRMIAEQIESRGVRNKRVLDAMRRVDRALFVPSNLVNEAYSDNALPIGRQQTISQPYIVALMTDLLDPQPGDRVLEIGCGTGYQTAILAGLAREVWSMDIIPELCESARERLGDLSYTNIHVLHGDGYLGLPSEAPFDKIMITAAPPVMPESLCQQLVADGRMILPVGVFDQDLIVIDMTGPGRWTQRKSIPVRFVPMVHHG